MEAPPHVHRSNTSLKQKNKAFKAGRHASKGELINKAKGSRGAVKSHSEKEGQKRNLRNAKKLQQQRKRDELLSRRRGLGARDGPPHIVGIITLSASLQPGAVRALLLSSLGERYAQSSSNPITVPVPQQKARFTLLEPSRDLNAVLDAAKVADVLLLVAAADEGVDALGQQLVSCIKAQGTPAVLGAVAGLERVAAKHRQEAKRALTHFLHHEFPGEPRLLPLDAAPGAAQVFRFLAAARPRPIHWREQRPYMLVERAEAAADGACRLWGYLRGEALSASQLLHLTDRGDFQLLRIEAHPDPAPLAGRAGADAMQTQGGAAGAAAVTVLDEADPARQESLQSENVPDPLGNDQTWPTEEEEREDQRLRVQMERTRRKRVPKGTSEYQAGWILDSDDEDGEEEGDEEVDGEDEEQEEELDAFGNTVARMEDGDDGREAQAAPAAQAGLAEGGGAGAAVATELDMEQAPELGRGKSKAELAAAAQDDVMWPDEVETPLEAPARVRFQRYRGLASFRTSPWDPFENLPRDYARIYQFENFARTARRVRREAALHPVQSGAYVCLVVRDLPAAALMASLRPGAPLLVWGLLKYEQCMSILHFAVQPRGALPEALPSKSQLLVHAGFRRYRAEPLFSQHNPNCDKHKFERFLQADRASVASVFAPITFLPCPVLLFKDQRSGPQLVASGSLLSVDPNRIVLKKIVLTGFPYKIHKRTAVIRDMFFNPDDINWFKPVELYTRRGRTGHILESLGTHGHMKVQFDGGIASDDTICMNLYKRVFPKWTTVLPSLVPRPLQQAQPNAAAPAPMTT